MGLSARDLLLVLRAQDMVSGTLVSIGNQLTALNGQSMTTAQKFTTTGVALQQIGGIMTVAGGAGLNFFNGATNAAIDWNKEVALASTQSRRVGVSFEDLKSIGKDVGSSIAVDLADINPALFDIFSTIDTNAPGAKSLLTDFSKAAVAGNVDIQDSARLTLAALNAWQLPTSKSTDLLDQQFKLVELGTGTYGEFASALGRAIPSAVGANQSFGDLGGMMAFLTKNGLSTAMSATSAARALDTIAKPKVVKALEDYGVSVKDANGNFRSMSDIITQLAENKGWAKMTGPERKAAFQEIFGTGTIQARRFFDLAIPNYQQLNTLTDQVKNSTGSMDTAYATMADTAAAKTQLMKNKYDLLKVSIGDQLIPAKMRLLEIVGSLIDKWNSLSPKTQEIIIKVAAAAAAFLAVVGPILMVVGSILLFIGVVAPLFGSVGAMVAAFGWLLVVVALVAAAAYLIYKNWDTVGPIFKKTWDTIKNAVSDAWDFIKPIIDEIVAGFKDFWDTLMNPGEGVTDSGFPGVMQRLALFLRNDVWPAVQTAWDALKSFAEWFANDAWPKIVDATQWVWDKLQSFWSWLTDTAVPAIVDFANSVKDTFQDIWDKAVEVYDWFDQTFGPGFQRIWDSLKENIPPIIDELKETWDSIKTKVQEVYDAVAPILDDLWTKWEEIHDKIMDKVEEVWGAIEPYISPVLDSLKTIIGDWITWLTTNWGIVWDLVSTQVSIAWNVISTIIASGIAIISNIIQLFLNILQGDWGEAWNNVKSILSNTWEIIKTLISGAVQTVMNLISNLMAVVTNTMSAGWNMMVSLVRAAFGQFLSTISSSVQSALSTIGRIPGQIQSIFSGAGSWLVNAGKAIVDGLIGGIGSKFQSLKNKLSELTGLIPSWKGPEDVDKKLLINSGELIMAGLQTGLETGWGGVRSYLKGLTTEANFTPTVNASATIRGDQPTKVQIINQDDNSREMLEAILALVDAIKDMPKAEDMAPVVVKDDGAGIWYKQEYSGV